MVVLMPVIAGEIATAAQPAADKATLQKAVTHRIFELDGDVEKLKDRREWAWLSTKEVTAINRLIKVLEASIKELHKQL